MKLDIIWIITKLNEIEKLKYILLDDSQRFIFSIIAPAVIDKGGLNLLTNSSVDKDE